MTQGQEMEFRLRNDLKSALDNLIKNKEISAEQKPSIGCNIKWK